MKLVKWLLIFPISCFSYPTFALTPSDIKACYDKASTTLAMRACANQEYTYYDKILNSTYQSLLPLLAQNQKAALITAQKAWLDYRTKECAFSALQHEGGSMQPIDAVDCYNMLNQTRIKELNTYIEAYSNQ